MEPAEPRPESLRRDRPVGPPEESCPSGTVPVEHFALEQLAAHSTLEDWLNRRGGTPTLPGSATSEHSWAIVANVESTLAAQAALNIWNPGVRNGEFLLSQVWLAACDGNFNSCFNGPSLETIEAGWIVAPGSPHLGLGDGGPETFCVHHKRQLRHPVLEQRVWSLGADQ